MYIETIQNQGRKERQRYKQTPVGGNFITLPFLIRFKRLGIENREYHGWNKRRYNAKQEYPPTAQVLRCIVHFHRA